MAIFLRATDEERETIKAAAARAGSKMQRWALGILLEAARGSNPADKTPRLSQGPPEAARAAERASSVLGPDRGHAPNEPLKAGDEPARERCSPHKNLLPCPRCP